MSARKKRGSKRPSLVVLSPDNVLTSFQKKRFSLKDFQQPHFESLKRIEIVNDEIKPTNDTSKDRNITTDTQRIQNEKQNCKIENSEITSNKSPNSEKRPSKIPKPIRKLAEEVKDYIFEEEDSIELPTSKSNSSSTNNNNTPISKTEFPEEDNSQLFSIPAKSKNDISFNEGGNKKSKNSQKSGNTMPVSAKSNLSESNKSKFKTSYDGNESTQPTLELLNHSQDSPDITTSDQIIQPLSNAKNGGGPSNDPKHRGDILGDSKHREDILGDSKNGRDPLSDMKNGRDPLNDPKHREDPLSDIVLNSEEQHSDSDQYEYAEEDSDEDQINSGPNLSSGRDFDVFRSPGFVDRDPDSISMATSAFSEALPPEELLDGAVRTLGLDELGPFMESVYPGLDVRQRRQLNRIGRLQTAHRRAWLSAAWAAFDERGGDPDMLWATARVAAAGAPPGWDFGLLSGARRLQRSFVRALPGGPDASVRAAVVGPRRSGKTTLLRAVLLQHLFFLASHELYKDVLVVSVDFRAHAGELDSPASVLRLFAERSVAALVGQRPDLSVVGPHLRAALAAAADGSPVSLPKPLETQAYLRRPLLLLEALLRRLSAAAKDDGTAEEVLTAAVALPRTLAEAFGIPRTLLVIDHLDYADTEIAGVSLLEFVKFGLVQGEFLVSAEDGLSLPGLLEAEDSASADVLAAARIVPVFGVCAPASGQQLVVEARGKQLVITGEDTGGCPAFVMQFEECVACAARLSRKTGRERATEEIKLRREVESLIDVMFEFADGEENIEVKSVSLR